MKNKGKKRDRPEKGSPRVQGWIYLVLNPLVDGIQREIQFLELGNLTWRFQSRTFEFLMIASGYVGPGARHTFDDFLKANPRDKPPIAQHDTLLVELRNQALTAYEGLCADQAFLRAVSEQLRQYESTPRDSGFAGGALSRAEFPYLVAERILNNVSQVPHHHADSIFWEISRDTFRGFRAGAAFRKLDESIRNLRRQDNLLVDRLGKTRYRLCERYDLPADPLPSMSHVAETRMFF